jgi:hypothetical protein
MRALWHDDPVATEPVTIKPQFPVLSRAGRGLAILSVPWFFVALVVLDALGPAHRDAPQALRWLSLFVAAAPGSAVVLHPWIGRLLGFRWLHHRRQPRVAIGANGLDLQLPELDAHLFGWEEINGLRMRPDRGADLLGPNGATLARIPESMILAGGTWWQSESIASLVVRARPDRYRLSGANWAGVPNEFALRMPEEPLVAAGRWAPRRRLVNVGITAAFIGVTGFLLLRYLTS